MRSLIWKVKNFNLALIYIVFFREIAIKNSFDFILIFELILTYLVFSFSFLLTFLVICVHKIDLNIVNFNHLYVDSLKAGPRSFTAKLY